MKKLFVFSLLATALVLSGCTTVAVNNNQAEDAKDVLELSFVDYSGKEVVLKDLVGTALVINSWASWCPFCVKELPDFVTIQKEFGDDVKFVAINRSEGLSVAKNYTDSSGISNDLIFLLDPKDIFYKSIGGFSMPETLFVDVAGNISFHRRGVMTESEIRQRVQQLINIK